jgi:hypothetical protein
MAFLAPDMGDKADAAGVMFVARIIKPLGLRVTHRFSPFLHAPWPAIREEYRGFPAIKHNFPSRLWQRKLRERP